MHAWAEMFAPSSRAGTAAPYTDQDYFAHVDGKPRYEGVAALLASRGIELPWGDPADTPEASTVCGLGNRKNLLFGEVLARDGVRGRSRARSSCSTRSTPRHPDGDRVQLRERAGRAARRRLCSSASRPSWTAPCQAAGAARQTAAGHLRVRRRRPRRPARAGRRRRGRAVRGPGRRRRRASPRSSASTAGPARRPCSSTAPTSSSTDLAELVPRRDGGVMRPTGGAAHPAAVADPWTATPSRSTRGG